jgi:CelD/BcsL family acetyltransferase involved in cellulose biosynthesis
VSGARLEISTVGDAPGLAALAPGWDALVYDMPRPSPFLLHGWVVAWWRAYGGGATLQVHVARRDGRLVGVLPLCVRREHGVRVLRFVGAGDSALADVLLAGGQDGEVAAALAACAAAGDHDYADLFGLPSGSRLAGALGPSRLSVVPRVAAPVLDLRRGWEAVYRERVSGKHRKAQARARRRLAEQGRLETRVARTAEELDRALDGAFALHALRWRDRPEGSGFATPAGRVLQREAFRALAADGVPWIVTLELDGRPIAFTAFFLLAGRMVLHHTAFDPAYARWSPGRAATYDALAAAADAGAWRVEFLGGAEAYKVLLADASEPLHVGLGLARGARGHAAVTVRRAGLVARRELARRPRLRRAWYDGLVPVRRAHRHLTRE